MTFTTFGLKDMFYSLIVGLDWKAKGQLSNQSFRFQEKVQQETQAYQRMM